jgi:hypothetical protein
MVAFSGDSGASRCNTRGGKGFWTGGGGEHGGTEGVQVQGVQPESGEL